MRVPEDRGRGSETIAPDCSGLNFFEIDPWLGRLLPLYLQSDLLDHLLPHFRRLGALAGGRLDELARTADRHPPSLHPRDRYGRDEDWIEYHPAYREMEHIAFGDFGLHAMSHRGGVLGWPEPIPAPAKLALQYLFVQAEFGLMCPISVTDTTVHLVKKFGSDELRKRLLERMLSQDLTELWKGTQFMTEKIGGSDVGALESTAVADGANWRLFGEKWFCSHADADVAMLLARPEGATRGTSGLGLFAMPRRLDDGSRNSYRIVRLKDKLGTRSMASGEIRLEGALAYAIGELTSGFKQMMDTVNLSRLSHGARAAAMMRRCLNEASAVAYGRSAFGRRLIEMPMVRRQVLAIMLRAEQALSMTLFAGQALEAAQGGSDTAASLLRILTPLLKFRACRDNVHAATAAMEIRGGNGYIEEWVNARLVRDAHIGVLWEGTSNVIAQDVIQRAVGKEQADRVLESSLRELLDRVSVSRPEPASVLRKLLERSLYLARTVAEDGEQNTYKAVSSLYHVATAVLMTWEATELEAEAGSRRLHLARRVINERLRTDDPLAAEATEDVSNEDPNLIDPLLP